MVFWVSVALLAYAQLGYPFALRGARGRGARRPDASRARPASGTEPPTVSLIVAAHDEGAVIAAKVANALALEWPRERLEVVVCSDGSQ